MPVHLQASMRSVPEGTVSFLPSTVRVTSGTIKPLFRLSPFAFGYSLLAGCPILSPALGERMGDALRHRRFCYLLERARLAVKMVFEFLAILLNVRNDRHCCRIAEWTERTSQHVLRQVFQVVDILCHAAAGMEARERLLHPVRAFTAGNAPATALVLVELGHPQGESDNAHLVVEHDDTAGAEHGAGFEHRIEIHRNIDLVRGENLHR